MDIKSIKDKVADILIRYEFTRNNDIDLIGFVYMEHYGIERDEPISQVFKKIKEGYLPCFESIRRCRQKLQEDEKYQGNVKTIRHQKENEIKEQIRFF